MRRRSFRPDLNPLEPRLPLDAGDGEPAQVMSLTTYDPPGSMTVYSPDPPVSAVDYPPAYFFDFMDIEYAYLATVPDADYLFDPYDPVTNPEGAIPSGRFVFAPPSDGPSPVIPDPYVQE